MKITERKLRRIIRSVIKESMDTYQIKNISDYGDNLYYTLYEYLQDLHMPQSVLDNCEEEIRELGQLLAQYQNAVNTQNRAAREDVISSIKSLEQSGSFVECPEIFDKANEIIRNSHYSR